MRLAQEFQVHPVPNTTPCAKRAQLMCRAKKRFAPSGTDFAQLQLLRARAPRGGMRRHLHINPGRDGRRGCELPEWGWARGRYQCSSRIWYDIRVRNSLYIAIAIAQHTTCNPRAPEHSVRRPPPPRQPPTHPPRPRPPPVGAPLPGPHPSSSLSYRLTGLRGCCQARTC